MNSPNVRPSDRAVLAAVLDPVSQAAATVVSGWVSLSTYARVMAVLSVGVLGAGATVDAKLRQATDAAGTGAKDITGKAITQLTKAGNDDNKQVIVNVKDTDLDVANGFTHVALSITVATAACLIAAQLFGVDAKYAPAADVATVDEVVG